MTVSVDPSAIMAARKIECEADSLYFTRLFMKQRLGTKMLLGQHHAVLRRVLDDVVAMRIPRLIINIPPGYGKTEVAVISNMARGLAKQAYSRFMHLSYSDSLARLNSSTTKDIVTSELYQAMWPRKLRADAKARGMWWTDKGGGIYASSTMGQVTGFRAGYMDAENFTGALIIDDPIKPIDVMSETMREQVNNAYSETVASRLAVEAVPVILVMQRLHYADLSGHLLRGGSGEKWHHLCLPALIDNSAPYPKENTHGIPIEHGLPDGWLWPVKHGDEHLEALKSHRRKWEAQYQQAPRKFDAEGALWTENLIDAARRRDVPWKKRRTVVGIDPATTTEESSDLTGIVVASKYERDEYSADEDCSGKYTPLQWAKRAMKAYDDHDADAVVIETNQGGDMCVSNLRNAGFTGRVIRVHASRGKHARAEPIVSLYEQGRVYHDADADLTELESEMLEYVPSSVKKSPDRMDALVWALTELAGPTLQTLAW